MNFFATARYVSVAAAVLAGALGAAPGSVKLLYQDTIGGPSGSQQSVTAIISIAPQSDGGMNVAVDATGHPPMRVAIGANGAMPEPAGTPSPERAQGALILQRVALFAKIRKVVPLHSSVAIEIPVLAPGASQPTATVGHLSATTIKGVPSLVATATTSTMATISPEKAKIKGVLPVRRVAERVKNAATPSHVTLPDHITAGITASVVSGAVWRIHGSVVHELMAHGQTTTLEENWSLKPSP